MSDDQRRAPENLLVLCHRHHVKTNDVERYPVSALQKMKAEHEAKWGAERNYDLPDEAAEQILAEEIAYWNSIDADNLRWLAQFDLAMPVKHRGSTLAHIEAVTERLNGLEEIVGEMSKYIDELPAVLKAFLTEHNQDTSWLDTVKYYNSPFEFPLWESRNLGVPNTLMQLRIEIQIIKVAATFEALRQNPNDQALKDALEKEQAVLSEMATSAAHVD